MKKYIKQQFAVGFALLAMGAHMSFADTASADQEQAVSNAAFQELLHKYFPMTPGEIRQFKAAAAQQQKANAEAPAGAPVESNSQIIPVSLKPGGPQPVVRVGQGMITSVVFTDQNGKVWPITSYSVGDPQSFNVNWNKKSGVLMIQGQKLYAHSNVAVLLEGLSVPIMVNLMIGQHKWDYLDYMQVKSLMPGDSDTSPDSLAGAPGYLTSVLNGVPPMGSVALTTSNSGVQAWSYQDDKGNEYYLILTQSTLLSPAWSARANGPGDTPYHAYQIPPTPFIMVSDQGNMVRVKIDGGDSE